MTFWTDPTGADVVNTYEDEEVSGRDGRSVNRGGAGQQIPGFNTGNLGFENAEGNRKVFTESIANYNNAALDPEVSSTLLPLNANAATAALLKNRLGLHNTTVTETMLQWIRGFDVDDPAFNASTNPLVRQWLMGDPIHSRPIAVNYGRQSGYTEENPNLRVFIGSNDGFIRAYKDSSSGANATGEELFAFMPNDLLMNNEALRYNVGGDAHPYGVDGAPLSMTFDYDQDGNIETADGDKVYLYFGLRRGGKSIYALDVSDPSDSITPTLAWKIKKPITVSGTNGSVAGNTNALQTNLTLTPSELKGGRLYITTGPHASDPEGFYHIIDNDDSFIYIRDDDDGSGNATPEFVQVDSGISVRAVVFGDSDFSELGLTFSTPKAGLVKFGSSSTPVLIFGAGYDIDKDDLGTADDDEGVGIYIVDAQSGELIWKAVGGSGTTTNTVYRNSAMRDSIPSTVTPLDSNGDGIIDRLYVGDTGGNVWRVDLPAGDASNWRRDNWFITKYASLGSDSAPNDRRFFHAPDVVITRDASGRYDGVIISSGNRPSPKRTDVDNYLFVMKDRLTTSGDSAVKTRTPIVIGDLTDITNLCVTGSETACDSANLYNGWKLSVDETGEKSLASPLIAQGTIFFTTYLPNGNPAESSCAPNEGSGRIYAVSLTNGSRAEAYLGSVVDPDCPRCVDAGNGIPPGATPLGSEQILLPGKGINGRQIVNLEGKTRWRTHWRERNIDNN